MTQEIKPCQFCGSSDCEEIYQNGRDEGWVVRCNSCGANGQAFESEQGAIKQWNDVALASAWQPIETAPKDGSHMLLFWSGSQEIKIGHYCE